MKAGRPYPRKLEPEVIERFLEEQVILIQGPRAAGKSTLLRSLAERLDGTIIDLDDPDVAEAVDIDLAHQLSRPGPILIDEYQHLPRVLRSIKAQLNVEGRPGRYILTGSTRHEALPAAAEALTGRLHRMLLLPLSQGEIAGAPETLLGQLLDDMSRESFEAGADSSTTRAEYIEKVVTGGMPLAVARRTPDSRNAWFDDYIRLTLERDVTELSKVRRAEALPRLLAQLAGQTGQVLNMAKAARACRLEPRTGESYVRLLESTFLIMRLPAWGGTLRTSVARKPKVHVVDTGVGSRLMRVTAEHLARGDATALSEFGHLLETFVVGELLKQASRTRQVSGYGHWRTHEGDEVDLVIERGDGKVVAFEVKAGAGGVDAGLRSLRRLRDAAGDRFLTGVLLNLGDRSIHTDDGLWVMPVDRIWKA